MARYISVSMRKSSSLRLSPEKGVGGLSLISLDMLCGLWMDAEVPWVRVVLISTSSVSVLVLVGSRNTKVQRFSSFDLFVKAFASSDMLHNEVFNKRLM